jgi:hypothetical protein
VFSIVLLALLFIYTFRLQQDNTVMQGHYQALQTSYTDLQVVHEVTLQENSSLEAQLSDLWVDYAWLNAVYNDLAAAYTGLEARFNELAGNYLGLENQYNSLEKEYMSQRS